MHAWSIRRLSHVPVLRALALFAWLVLASVPVFASAQASPPSIDGGNATMHADGAMQAGDCCQGHADGGHAPGPCEACSASSTGLILPVTNAVPTVRFEVTRWPTTSVPVAMRSFTPPLRPPRS